MSNLNKCMFIGRITRDPEVIETNSGSAIVKFGIAINEKYKGEDKTEFINIVCFGNSANYVREYQSKGALVYVEGKMQTSSWDDKDGNKKYKTEIVAFTVQGLSKGEGAPKASAQASEPDNGVDASDLPF